MPVSTRAAEASRQADGSPVCVWGGGGALDSAMQQRARGACGRKRWKKTHLSSVP